MTINFRTVLVSAAFAVALAMSLSPSHAFTQDAPAETPEPPTEPAQPAASVQPTAPAVPAEPPAPAPSPEPTAPAPAPTPAAPPAPASAPTPVAAPIEPAAAAPPANDEAEELVIVGTRLSRTPGSAHVLGTEQLERAERDDPLTVLQQVPGVYVRQEDGMGLRPNIGLRGAAADRSKKVTLLEDGVLFGPAPYTAPAAYYFPLMTRMTEVRVIKGPSAVAYGPQTVGGAVNFITRKIPTETTAKLDLSYGSFGYAKGHGYFGSSTDQVGFLVEGVHLHTDGFKELPDGGDTGSTRNEWMAKTSYLIDPSADTSNELQLKLTYSDEVSNETYLGLSDADFRDEPYQRYEASALDQMKNHRTSLVLSHVLDTGSGDIQLTTTGYRHDYARAWRKANRFRGRAFADVLHDPEDPANAELYAVLTGEAESATGLDTVMIGPNDRTFVSEGLQSVLMLRETTGAIEHRIEAGTRLHYDSVRRKHSEDGFLVIGGELQPEGMPTIVTTANEESSLAFAAHVLDTMTWSVVTLSPGARIEVIRSERDDLLTGASGVRSFAAVMPGVGAYVALTDELGVLAGVYRGFSPPPPGSEAHVDPEYSVNYEAGARYTKGKLRAELIGFFNDYSNLTDICSLASGCLDADLDRQFDAGDAHIYGLEAFFAVEPKLGSLRMPLSAAYTYTHGEFRSDFQSQDPIFGTVEKGDEVPYLPRHQVSTTVAIEGARAGGFVGFNYVARMREEAGSEPLDDALTTDEQLIFDIGASYRIWDPIELYANVRNLFDAADIVSRRPFGARPNAPRWILVGAKAQL